MKTIFFSFVGFQSFSSAIQQPYYMCRRVGGRVANWPCIFMYCLFILSFTVLTFLYLSNYRCVDFTCIVDQRYHRGRGDQNPQGERSKSLHNVLVKTESACISITHATQDKADAKLEYAPSERNEGQWNKDCPSPPSPPPPLTPHQMINYSAQSSNTFSDQMVHIEQRLYSAGLCLCILVLASEWVAEATMCM